MQLTAFPNDVLDPLIDGNNYSLAYIKIYFGAIFDEVNHLLDGSQVQMVADYSDLYNSEFDGMKEKYCRVYDISGMTTTFFDEFAEKYEYGTNKIFILNCRENNAILPTADHFSFIDSCATTHGMILTDLGTQRQLIVDGLMKIFANEGITKVSGMKLNAQINVCKFADRCVRYFDGIGEFEKDLKRVYHLKNHIGRDRDYLGHHKHGIKRYSHANLMHFRS